MRTKYIFVTGGVISGVGKGIATASIGKILSSSGFTVTSMKIDPYVNVDAGTMNPTEHGEVFVLDDGTECDQDMGNYERYLDRDLSRENYMTTGSIYLDVIQKERRMEYKGKCVEVVPQVPLAIIDKIDSAAKKAKADIITVEIGGTVGEYQNILFLEAVRMLKFKKPNDVMLVLVSLLPTLPGGGTEIKSKPTQYAVRTLNAAGLQPDIIIGRASIPLDDKRKQTIALNCNLDIEDIISAPNVSDIHEIPINFEKGKICERIVKKLKLRLKKCNLNVWQNMVKRANEANKIVKIGIVGKYFGSGNYVLTDSYISVLEAIRHAGIANRVKTEISWIDSEEFESASGRTDLISKTLKGYDGICVPGGFGSRGVEGKILAIKYAREHKIPYLGLCYGMQLATIEFARNVAGLKKAHTTEIDPKTPDPVIHIMPDQEKKMLENDYGGTMRLGAYPCNLVKGTKVFDYYKKHTNNRLLITDNFSISERHRHRFEFNNKYREILEKKDLVISGTSPDNLLVEIIELKNHPFFVGTQFHPEFKSRPLKPHPLFFEFIKASIKNSD